MGEKLPSVVEVDDIVCNVRDSLCVIGIVLLPNPFYFQMSDVADPGLIGQGSGKLPVQHIVRHCHGVFAVGGMDEFASPDRAQLVSPHCSCGASRDRKSTRLNSSHRNTSRMPSSA